MSKFICICVECGYHDWKPAYINPSAISSFQEDFRGKVRVTMSTGEFFDTCYSLPKFMEILNGEGGADDGT